MPTALRVLRGNPGNREINTHEPRHAPLDARSVPNEIAKNAIARDEWKRIAPGLATCGQLTVGDRAAMIGYCLKYAHWRELEAIVAREGAIIPAENGGDKIHPAAKLANATFQLFLRAAVEIGLTPSSRSRIVAIQPAPPVSKWHGVLK